MSTTTIQREDMTSRRFCTWRVVSVNQDDWYEAECNLGLTPDLRERCPACHRQVRVGPNARRK